MVQVEEGHDVMNMGSSREFYEEYHARPQTHFLGRVMQQARIRTLRRFWKSATNGARGEILIIGCGSGGDIAIADQEVYALDLSLAAVVTLKKAKRGNHYLCGDATSLPFETESFDIIICSEVIEHIPDAKKVILEFHRVLKPDGKLLLTTPNWLSFYGLVRKLAETVTRKPVTSAGQPVDNWYTFRTLARILSPEFTIIHRRGIWYFPPTGKGMIVIPAVITYPIYIAFRPFEELLSRSLPGLGHMLAVLCKKSTV